LRRSKNCRIENRFRNQNERKNMKITTTLIAAIVGMTLFAGVAYKAAGNDGITASPKLREMITARDGVSAQPAALAAHNCAMCKDEDTTRVDQAAKGVIKPTLLFVTHLCPGCETRAATTGHGKAAQNVVTHKCTSESGACCAAESACCAEKAACCAAKEACCAPKT
jgi:hypothetical protein